MTKISIRTLLRVSWKIIVVVNVAVLLLVNYKRADLDEYLKNFTDETILYVPKCFDSFEQLVDNISDTRWRLEITCNQSEPTVITKQVNQHQEPCQLSWKQHLKCLTTFIRKKCYLRRGQTVPNIVHYVWFGHNLFKPEYFISVLSAVRFQQPCAILFHCKESPFGPYWEVLLSIVSNIILVLRDEPENIFGTKFGFIQHKADVVRLEVLNATGGIYLDTDQLLVRDIHELLNETLVMSHENKKNLANSMILAKPAAPFIEMWYQEYRSYMPKKWGYHSTVVPWSLAKKHPKMIKVVGNRFVNPDLTNILQVINGQYDITGNYGLHLYTRFHPALKLQLPEVTAWNTSLGKLCRTILFDSSEMFTCPDIDS